MKSFIQIIFLCLIVLFLTSVFFVFDNSVVQNIDYVVLDEDIVNDSNLSIDEKDAEIATETSNDTPQEDTPIVKQELIIEQPAIPRVEKESEKVPQISFSEINKDTRDALVNIFCTTKSGGPFKPITGSGVIIDDRGIILTNAHVAQYFLLKDYITKDFINCVIRVGSPAKPMYKAKLIFISPSWVKENANEIIQQEAKGPGEDDYALLIITERTDPSKTLPDTFSFIEPLYNSSSIDIGDNVLLAAYPAGFLNGIAISRDLYISSAVTQIMEIFTFRDGTFDLFSIGGSVVAQQGSSGGAVVDSDNKLLGIIVTSTVADTTGERDLRAITITHMNRSFVEDTSFDLQTFLSGNMEAEANVFKEKIAPTLKQLLVDGLEK